ncbi:ABC transporter substrate-binding protein [Bartonella apis]|uniref:ABC transporter substrate-binding protein n=1 Tax=Bartonella apis TaxID=1686310 RepID=UPI0026EB7562|nr:ABC transporter substrate-binding protein [Bartonella apis]
MKRLNDFSRLTGKSVLLLKTATRYLLACLLSGCGIFLLCAPALLCARANASELKIALQDDPDNLDPALAKTFSGRLVYTAMCDKLIDISKEADFVPELAQSWSFSDDGKTLKLHLRKDVIFHDGTPFNADAAIYSLKRAMSFSHSVRENELSSVSGIEATGPFEVTIKLKYPDAALLSHLADRAGVMVSPKAAREMGSDFGLKPVCAGPFRFVEHVPHDRIVLEKFDRYWNSQEIKLDRVTFLSIEDPSVRFSNLRAGIVDMTDRLSSGDFAKAKTVSRLKTERMASEAYIALTINIANGSRSATPLGQQKRLRQAFSLAIDRASIRDNVYGGAMVVGNQPWAPDTIWFNSGYPVPPRNLEKARELIQQAGFANQKIDVQISHSNEPTVVQAMQAIKVMADEAGFNVSLHPKEETKLAADNSQGNFEVSAQKWSGRIDPDGNVYWFVTCEGGDNIGKYCNPDLDKKLSAAREALDPAERADLYHYAASVLQEDMPIIYLGHPDYIYAYTKKLHGFHPYPDGMIRFSNMYKD